MALVFNMGLYDRALIDGDITVTVIRTEQRKVRLLFSMPDETQIEIKRPTPAQRQYMKDKLKKVRKK